MYHKYLSLFIMVICCTLISACSSHGVKSWQKRELARPEMQFNSNLIESSFEEHFYFSKEGSTGGRGFSGGGCGCN